MYNDKNPLTVKPSKAFTILNISTATGYRWIKSGKLATIKIGNRYLIPVSVLEDLLEKKKNNK